ncbi:MAG: hypothetical protein QOG96_59, partial [Pseudonocardiales bacterium]|nr:hypothetical protein [Pseudonocardiales bacterium]
MGATRNVLPDREVLGELIRELDTAAPYDLVDVCEEWLGRWLGARWSTLLLADY